MSTAIGPLHVRRSVLIDASAQRVWREFETPARVKAWLNSGHTLHDIELRVGGAVDFSVQIEGENRHFGGSVLVLEQAREMTLAVNWRAPHALPVSTFWTFRLTPLYGATLVELFHHGFERLGRDAGENLDGYETGWQVRHLSALRAIVESAG